MAPLYASRISHVENIHLRDVEILMKIRTVYKQFYMSKIHANAWLPVNDPDIEEIWCMGVVYLDEIALPHDEAKIFLACVGVYLAFLDKQGTQTMLNGQKTLKIIPTSPNFFFI